MTERKHGHYFRDVTHLTTLDFYRLVELFDIRDGAVQHILKKCLAVGERGHKDLRHDLQDMIDTAQRKLDMLREDDIVCAALHGHSHAAPSLDANQ